MRGKRQSVSVFKESGISREKVLTRGQRQVKPFYNQLAEQACLQAGLQHVGGRRRPRAAPRGCAVGAGGARRETRTRGLQGGEQGGSRGEVRGPHPRTLGWRARGEVRREAGTRTPGLQSGGRREGEMSPKPALEGTSPQGVRGGGRG